MLFEITVEGAAQKVGGMKEVDMMVAVDGNRAVGMEMELPIGKGLNGKGRPVGAADVLVLIPGLRVVSVPDPPVIPLLMALTLPEPGAVSVPVAAPVLIVVGPAVIPAPGVLIPVAALVPSPISKSVDVLFSALDVAGAVSVPGGIPMGGAVTVTVRVPEPLGVPVPGIGPVIVTVIVLLIGLALGTGIVVPLMGMVVLKVPVLIGSVGAVTGIVNVGPGPTGAVPVPGKVGNMPVEPFPKDAVGVRLACLLGGIR